MSEEIPENESKEERKKRLTRLRTRRYRAKRRIKKEQEEWINGIGKPTKSEFTPKEPSKQKDQFDNLELELGKTFGSSEEQKIAESKALESALNELLETQTTRNICSKCKSNPCHCYRQDLYQNGED